MSAFHTLVQEGSFAGAARVLGSSAVELDGLICELETALSTSLLHRRALCSSDGFASLPIVPTDSGLRWFLLIGELLKSASGSGGFEGIPRSFLDSFCDALSSLFVQTKSVSSFHLVRFFFIRFRV